MKRFYCTVCQRVKRVQKWPAQITYQESVSPKLREGVCDKHSKPVMRTLRSTTIRKRA